MIKLKAVNKMYRGEGNDYAALKDISLHINAGEYVLITGKSGSGKSTLLNILTGVDSATSGDVNIGGTNIAGQDEAAMTEWRGQNVGIVFQFFQLIPTLSVIENILLPMDLIGTTPSSQREEKAHSLLEMVGMESHANKMPSTLSGGEQQRVAIARALANDVGLIVADEPTGNLDSANSEIIYDLLCSLHRAGKTIVMVTHDTEIIKGAQRKIVLRDGRVLDDYKLEKVASA